MKSVVFKFDESASEENQDRLGNHIRDLPGVSGVGRISPTAVNPALRRLWYAEVADEAAATDLVKQLRQREEIQSADLPAERGLL